VFAEYVACHVGNLFLWLRGLEKRENICYIGFRRCEEISGFDVYRILREGVPGGIAGKYIRAGVPVNRKGAELCTGYWN